MLQEQMDINIQNQKNVSSSFIIKKIVEIYFYDIISVLINILI